MEIQRAIEILKRHNQYRRRSSDKMVNPTVLGEAIDCVVREFESYVVSINLEDDRPNIKTSLFDDCKCCEGTGLVEGEHFDDKQPCMTCNGRGK